MAKTLVPTSWLTGYTSNGTTLSIPLSTLTGLTAGEAHATTGDVRKIIHALLDKYYTATMAKVIADRLAQCTITRVDTQNQSGYTRVYSVVVKTSTTVTDLGAEA